MTELEAWKTIGDAYGTQRSKRTARQKLITRHGICWAATVVDPNSKYSICGTGSLTIYKGPMREKMGRLIREDMPAKRYGWNWFCSPKRRANDLLRADYCYLQYWIIKTGGLG